MATTELTTQGNSSLQIAPARMLVAKQIDAIVLEVGQAAKLNGFEKALIQATAIEQITLLIDDDYIKSVKTLAGKKIGFLTDLDKEGGYKDDTIKTVVIEAVLKGLQIVGNQFNILAGKMYPTKEGFTYLLRQIAGLSYEHINELPQKDGETTYVKFNLNWTIDGQSFTRVLTFAVKVNANMSTDAIVGKAERKVKAWLYNHLTNSELADGDVEDAKFTVVSSSTKKTDETNGGTAQAEEVHAEELIVEEEPIHEDAVLTEEEERAKVYINESLDLADLETRWGVVIANLPDCKVSIYDNKKAELTK